MVPILCDEGLKAQKWWGKKYDHQRVGESEVGGYCFRGKLM